MNRRRQISNIRCPFGLQKTGKDSQGTAYPSGRRSRENSLGFYVDLKTACMLKVGKCCPGYRYIRTDWACPGLDNSTPSEVFCCSAHSAGCPGTGTCTTQGPVLRGPSVFLRPQRRFLSWSLDVLFQDFRKSFFHFFWKPWFQVTWRRMQSSD